MTTTLTKGTRVAYENANDDAKVPPNNGDTGTVEGHVKSSPFVRVKWDLYGEILVNRKFLVLPPSSSTTQGAGTS